MPGGRPTLYKETDPERGYRLALLGLTDIEIAMAFDIHVDTLNEWKHVHPEFSESLNRGKVDADAHVANRLYCRAMGYEHEDVALHVVQGEVVQTPIVKKYPPDATSMIFWLKNRQRAKWRDKVDTEVTGSDGGPLQQHWNIEFVSPAKKQGTPDSDDER